MVFSKDAANAWMAAGSGRFAFAGGIMPARSLRIIFSTTGVCSRRLAASNDASDSPPALPRSLWQVAQTA
jgi:hypothetical protein